MISMVRIWVVDKNVEISDFFFSDLKAVLLCLG
jgi:hypothetical protein